MRQKNKCLVLVYGTSFAFQSIYSKNVRIQKPKLQKWRGVNEQRQQDDLFFVHVYILGFKGIFPRHLVC
jgi:hypothetical protein